MVVTNRFKGLNLIDKVTEELFVQGAGIKNNVKKKKCKKAKWFSDKVLKIAEKRREVKGKGKIYPSECRVPKKSKER